MEAPPSDQREPTLRDSVVPPLPAPQRRRLSLFFQWLIVAGIGLSLVFLIRLHPQQSTTAPVDQISCDQGEQLAFHNHAHLSIFIDGQMVTIPATIGIAADGCLYWLHTHAPDGIIHMEAPQSQSFELGNFLDIWKQRFSQLDYPRTLDQTTGWLAFDNGKPVAGNFRAIPLEAHTLVTLTYHSPGVRPDTAYNWGGL